MLWDMSISDADREARLVPTRIIAIALMGGPTIFLGVVLFLVRSGTTENPPEDWHQFLDWIALGMGLWAFGAHVLVPRLVKSQGADPLMSYQRATITRLAFSEGAALFGCVAYLITGRPMGAGVAIAMILFMAGAQFPSRYRLDNWLDA
jgi:hypothetical protein